MLVIFFERTKIVAIHQIIRVLKFYTNHKHSWRSQDRQLMLKRRNLYSSNNKFQFKFKHQSYLIFSKIFKFLNTLIQFSLKSENLKCLKWRNFFTWCSDKYFHTKCVNWKRNNAVGNEKWNSKFHCLLIVQRLFNNSMRQIHRNYYNLNTFYINIGLSSDYSKKIKFGVLFFIFESIVYSVHPVK